MLLPLPVLTLAFLLAAILMAAELLGSRTAACPECPHCRGLALAEERRQQELQDEYARRVGLEPRDESRRPS
ncbi:MAG TPA: hypothetical protein VF763_12610 [Candidatus Limnocylindrales bacterium]